MIAVISVVIALLDITNLIAIALVLTLIIPTLIFVFKSQKQIKWNIKQAQNFNKQYEKYYKELYPDLKENY
jgi:c-di-AMP phosphodiesterase-like protein